MAYEPKPGDGALFRNERKTADNHPNATGYVIAHRDIRAGEKLNLAAWTKDGAKGKFQSLKMSDMRGSSNGDNAESRQSTTAEGQPGADDTEIPF